MTVASPAFVMAAPNGARRGRADHENLPLTPAELAREAVRCRDAGAAAIHVHVRDAEGRHSLDTTLYREAFAAIREAVGDDLVLQATTESVGIYDPDAQIRLVRELVPEAVSLALRELSPAGEGEDALWDLFAFMHARNIWPQLILYDVTDVERFAAMQLRRPFSQPRSAVLLVLGRYASGQVAEAAELPPMLAALAPVRDDVEWAVCAFGPTESAIVPGVLAEGGHMRVGFENNFVRADGRRAEHTADLVADAVAAARRAGRGPMSGPELRRAAADWSRLPA